MVLKVGVLFSGGKDSTFALYKALNSNELDVKCLLNINSLNKDSYMFQSAANNILESQSKSIGLPIFKKKSEGKKEEELNDLKNLIKEAKIKYKIKGIISGAINSTYQATRIQKICDELNIYSINPLWQINSNEYIEELFKLKFKIIIVKISAYPLIEEILGAEITKKTIDFFKKNRINIIGEGGEFETLVINSPIHKKIIEIKNSIKIMEGENCGELIIKEINLK